MIFILAIAHKTCWEKPTAHHSFIHSSSSDHSPFERGEGLKSWKPLRMDIWSDHLIFSLDLLGWWSTGSLHILLKILEVINSNIIQYSGISNIRSKNRFLLFYVPLSERLQDPSSVLRTREPEPGPVNFDLKFKLISGHPQEIARLRSEIVLQ